jgi:exoribonuclease R
MLNMQDIDDSSQSSQIATPPNDDDDDDDDDDDIMGHYSKIIGNTDDPKTEIESYLQEEWVPYNKLVDLTS